ncbi:MAG: C4-dicarboxylate transporter substrate-binding protein [Enterovirga sp.]|nr:C4-dicarboxylate transporter substrate-binding protein [Enterovirga sp.]
MFASPGMCDRSGGPGSGAATDGMRRRQLSLLACLPALVLGMAAAMAAEIKIIAPSAPGSGWDQLAKALALGLTEPMGPLGVEVVNVPGGGGTVGLAHFLASGQDGEMLVTGLTMITAGVMNRAPVEVDRLTPVARLAAEPFAIAVPAASPLKSLADLRAAIHADTGKLSWAGGPFGGIDHLAAMLLARGLDIEPGRLNYVPFLTSAEAASAVADEKVSAAVTALGELQGDLSAGRVRLLGTSASERIEGIDAPTFRDSGIKLELMNWRGVVGRPGLDRAAQVRLALAVQDAIRSPAWLQMLDRKKWRSAYLGPDEFGAFMRDEQVRVKEALKAAGLLKKNSD